MDAETIREFATRIVATLERGETPRRFEVLRVAQYVVDGASWEDGWTAGRGASYFAVAEAVTNHPAFHLCDA